MKKLVIIALMFAAVASFGQNKNAKATIEVDGVCGMCKTRIEKACFKTKGVKSANWSIETHKLKLVYNENKTNMEVIKKNILAVGHDVEDMKASDEAYARIHGCCKYRDEEIVNEHK